MMNYNYDNRIPYQLLLRAVEDILIDRADGGSECFDKNGKTVAGCPAKKAV